MQGRVPLVQLDSVSLGCFKPSFKLPTQSHQPLRPRETLTQSDGLLGSGREEREWLSFTPEFEFLGFETLAFEFYMSFL